MAAQSDNKHIEPTAKAGRFPQRTIRTDVALAYCPMAVTAVAKRGSCLCGAVVYEVHGPLRDVLICHCVECRRWHGHVSASTAASREDLVVVQDRGLRWIDSPHSDAHARRGFCGECGSTLFWAAAGAPTISIAAGSLDDPSGLQVAGHWYVSQAGAYYDVPDDGLPHHSRAGDGRT